MHVPYPKKFSFVITVLNSCPVQMFKLYRSKLHPGNNLLWQRPRQGNINYIDTEWFETRAVGKDMLERFMKINLGKSITLHNDYTNHSNRSTVITNLDRAGFEARHIMRLSSHKSESTIKEYATKCPEGKRKEMFDSLSNAMKPKSTGNDTPNIEDVQQNLPNFQLDPLDFDTIDDNLLANLITDLPQDTENSNNNNNIQPSTTKNKRHASFSPSAEPNASLPSTTSAI